MKDSNDVIHEFNEIVNMTSSELEKWLKSGDSRSAGWPKEDEDGESVGHDSGRKIVDILKSNPNKDPEKYTDDQISHMRKVVSYCKRHLAQEKQSHANKSNEEVKQTKSYASLKNWGHDPLKGEENGGEDDAEEEDEDNTQENTEQDEKETKQAGDKRKKDHGTQAGANKKRETRQGKASSNGNKGSKKQEEDDDDDQEGEDEQETNGKDDDDDDNDEEEEEDGNDGDSGKKTKKGPKPGEKVSWSWGGGNPEGKVLDVKGEDTTITTKRGNKVTRKGDPEDPAVVLDTGKSKAVKSNHELN